MTAAQQLRQQGRQEGIQQGLEKTARNMLKKGYTADIVKELTGLAKEELKQLQAGVDEGFSW